MEIYASTEYGLSAVQTWTKSSMTFVPFGGFWEFIPFEDHLRSKEDPSYQPETVLYDELQPGVYEMVGTNFHGGALVRYRIGDLIRVTALEDAESGVKLPQIVFETRGDDVVDLGGFTRLTEKTFVLAMARCGLPWEEWAVVKEMEGDKPQLHLYLELKPGSDLQEAEIATSLHEALKEVDADYRDLESMVGAGGIRVTLLPEGIFMKYTQIQAAKGADLGHMKPARILPQDALDTLLSLSTDS